MLSIYQGESAQIAISLIGDNGELLPNIDNYQITALLICENIKQQHQIRWNKDSMTISDGVAILCLLPDQTSKLIDRCSLEIKLIDVLRNVVIAKCDTLISVKKSILGCEV